MGETTAERQAKTKMVGIRVTPLEHELLTDLAFVRDTTVDALVREHGIDRAVQLAREIRERLSNNVS